VNKPRPTRTEHATAAHQDKAEGPSARTSGRTSGRTSRRTSRRTKQGQADKRQHPTAMLVAWPCAGRRLIGSCLRPGGTRRTSRSLSREDHQRSSGPVSSRRDSLPAAGRDREPVPRAIGLMPIPSGSRRVEHVRPILDHASCHPPLRADRPRKRAFQICPAGQLCRCRAPHRGRPPIPLIECYRIHPGPAPEAPAAGRRQMLTRSAAAEYRRAGHEPRSPGSAGVPPACGLRSVFRPWPTG
jgi:hypothetical protein